MKTRKRGKENFGHRLNMNGVEVAGIDVGENESTVTLLSQSGEVKETFSFSMDENGYDGFASKVPMNARIAFEASGSAYDVNRRLRSLGYSDITVASPKELSWIAKSKKKNDRVDSAKIAKLHLVNMLPEAHLLERNEQIARDLLIQRVKLGQEIGSLKSTILSYLKREGIEKQLPNTTDNFSSARRKATLSLKFGDDRDLVLKTMMDRLEFLERQTEPLQVRIKAIASESNDVRLLMTVPGIDFYLASLLSSYIGDANRFPSFDHLASYFGIIPETRDSSSIRRRGRMSKDGPSLARWALTVAVDTTMKMNKPIREYYRKEVERTGSGKYAHVLTAKKLLRMMYHMLKTGEHWKWEDEALTGRKMESLDGSQAE